MLSLNFFGPLMHTEYEVVYSKKKRVLKIIDTHSSSSLVNIGGSYH